MISSVLVLAGCTPTTLPEFEASQTDRDIILDVSAQDIDADSTRFIGEVEGADLYLARGTNNSLCLIQIRDEEWEQMGCGAGLGVGSTLESGTRIEAGTFKFPDNEVGEGKRTPLSDSVTVIYFP